ncbi:MAG: TIM barrel protein [Ginsengibacter sp.]
MGSKQTRRTLIKNIAFGASAALAAPADLFGACDQEERNRKLKGNINHAVCRWTFGDLSLAELCKVVKEIGFNAIDLVKPEDWPILQQHGIFCSMCYTAGKNDLTKGLNDPSLHAGLVQEYLDVIPLMAKAKFKNLICFSGNRNGMDDETGMKNCMDALHKILPFAEKNGVTMIMELLNSKVDHKDYMCDKSEWGVELCKRINSPNFLLLYDIYHMQINEGDIIRTIRDNYRYFGHYHTGGVPGRHEINDTQELYYPAVMRAIKETGFKDYVAQEFAPSRKDKVASLREAIRICDV